MLPLEDTFSDIIGKTMRGLVLTDAQVAARAGLSADAVKSLREGAWDEATARKVAPVLNLQPDALVASGNKSWQPQPVALEGLAQFNTPFEDMTVNAYLAWDPASREAVAFDTGADCTPILDFLAEKKLTLKSILITHTHTDHILELDRLREKTGAPAFVGDREPIDGAESFPAGRTFEIGALKIDTRLTWGHSKGAISYVIGGLAKPVVIVGDAVFAGSMGGGMISFEAALKTNRAEIFTLTDDTILCPGHGPLSTIGEEKKHNPFFA